MLVSIEMGCMGTPHQNVVWDVKNGTEKPQLEKRMLEMEKLELQKID